MPYARDKKAEDRVAQQEEEDGEPTFDQTPVRVNCPHCGLNVITFIEHEASWVTYAVSIVLLLVLNWAALCVVPVVYPLFKDVVHHCPRCLSVLATRSRVVLPSWKQEVMSFRFGSCVVVLARKYVMALAVLVTVIGGIHMLRTSGSQATGLDAVQRGPSVQFGWEDFVRDCGFKSYLGNPIHVTVAFNDNYKNKTVHWEGAVHHIEDGLSFLWWSQRGAIFVQMQPAQFPTKRDMPDLVLLYKDSDPMAANVAKLRKGATFGFDATMVEVGKRGAPHVAAVWEVWPTTATIAPRPAAEAATAEAGTAATDRDIGHNASVGGA